jgi:catechol 2,3-dioxygenase-like lactoylglutathione lyase family enzyme
VGIPGLRGTDHSGFTVPDLDEALAFLQDVLGLELVARRGALEDGAWFERHMELDASTAIVRWAIVRTPDGAEHEVFEFRADGQRRAWPPMSDHGGHHLALRVEDMDAAVAHLAAHGVTVMGGPVASRASPDASFGYFHAPWGQLLELVRRPGP